MPASAAFSADAVSAASGPLLQVKVGADGLPAVAVAAARVRASPARLWAVVSDIERYPGRVPLIHRVRVQGDRVTAGLRFKLPLFSVGFEFVADVLREEGRSQELRWVSGEPRALRLRFDLSPIAGADETLVESTAALDVRSLGWLAKYFLSHHPEIEHGILPGVALALLDAMRRAADASGPPV